MAVYLEEFVDSVANLPGELKHHLLEIRGRDEQYHDQRKQIIRLQKEYLHERAAAAKEHQGTASTAVVPETPLSATAAGVTSPLSATGVSSPSAAAGPRGIKPPPGAIERKYQAARALMDEKLMIAERTVELLQKHSRKLEECIADATRDLEEAGMLNLVNGGLAAGSLDFSDSPDRPRSRNRKQPRGAGASGSLMDTSAADDADMFDEDGGEPVYCLCRQVSFGEMIACDNAGKCPYEWFHYECVGLAEPPRGLWYCPVCAPKMKRKMLKKEQRMAE